jgi:hypothetical protein
VLFFIFASLWTILPYNAHIGAPVFGVFLFSFTLSETNFFKRKCFRMIGIFSTRSLAGRVCQQDRKERGGGRRREEEEGGRVEEKTGMRGGRWRG